MESYKLNHISSERDLDSYDNYLKKSTVTCKEISLSSPASKPEYFQDYLKNHKGKLLKVECLLSERLECRTGILMAVGKDYLVLKLQRNCLSMMIPTSHIKYITIIHDNDIKKAGTKIR